MVSLLIFLLINTLGSFNTNHNSAAVKHDAATITSARACSTCTFVIAATQTTIDGAILHVKPGDVICLNSATKYSTLIFKNIVGTSTQPVTITNCGGTVNITVTKPWNLKTSYCKYFRLTGGDTDGTYGIRLTGSTANGIILTDLSTNFEVDHMEVYNVGFAGIMAKTDPTCDDATIRGNFTMRDVSFHHNYIHDTGGEGFYIGHTSYGGVNIAACGVRLPHTIEGVDIYKNHVVRSGWDGIQLSCATKDAAVFDNLVEDYAVKNTLQQQNGIILGAGTGGLCYNNFVNKGTGGGITVFGLGDNIIHDNVVLNAGEKGMFCDERASVGPGFQFINNTIINPKTEGIAIYSETLPKNVCINNIIVNPGAYSQYLQSSYVMLLKGVPVINTNNYYTRTIDAVKFVDPTHNNFKLQSSSPAVNKGADISTYNIQHDFYGAPRKDGTAYDIGASEY
jgi:hypothetical protein